MSMSIKRDQTPSVAILDPFYMRESVLMDDGDTSLVAGYIKEFMLENTSKDLFLTTYSPNEDQDCVLICFSLKHSHAVYLDLASARKKDYKYIMRVLDHALAGYKEAGGKIVKHKFSKHQSGVSVFNHVTQFPCVKQPAGSVRDAYCALHHMRAIVQD
nr:uncharacterized protein LOC120972560 [Aegilops tauschii subsp. strangulata]